MTTREELDTNDELTDHVRPAREQSTTNAHAVRCGVCDALYYVGDHTYDRVRRALVYDPTDNPFVCDSCDDGFADEEHRT